MSTLLPSACAVPLVTSGTAVTPPVPVDVVTPLPVRMNHSSSVKSCAPSPPAPVPAADPKVTRSSSPSNCSAYSGAAFNRDSDNSNTPTMRQMVAVSATEGVLRRILAPSNWTYQFREEGIGFVEPARSIAGGTPPENHSKVKAASDQRRTSRVDAGVRRRLRRLWRQGIERNGYNAVIALGFPVEDGVGERVVPGVVGVRHVGELAGIRIERHGTEAGIDRHPVEDPVTVEIDGLELVGDRSIRRNRKREVAHDRWVVHAKNPEFNAGIVAVVHTVVG